MISQDNPDSKIILDGNAMSLMIQIEKKDSYKQKPPMAVLLPLNSKSVPYIQIAEEKNGFFYIEFCNMQAGEYTFYLDE